MRTQRGPSLNRSIGYDHFVNNDETERTITIIKTNYLKNLRDELLEEDGNKTEHNNTEIAYIIAEINGVYAKIMIDTAANVSLIDSIELHKIQEKSMKIIPTLPVNNIVLIGAAGRQNKTLRKQVMLELTSNGETISIEFLVANGLPFTMLIGCDMLRKYSAIIDMSRAKVTLNSNCVNWTTKLIGSESAPLDRAIYNVREIKDHRQYTPSDNIFYENDDGHLWSEKLEEIHTFKKEKKNAQLTNTQVEKLMSIYNNYRQSTAKKQRTAKYNRGNSKETVTAIHRTLYYYKKEWE